MHNSSIPTVPVSGAHGPAYNYAAALIMLREASRLAERAAERAARVLAEYEYHDIEATCDLIVAGCEARAMLRAVKGGSNHGT